MLRALCRRVRSLFILASLLVSVGVMVPVLSFAKPAPGWHRDPGWSATRHLFSPQYSFRTTTPRSGSSSTPHKILFLDLQGINTSLSATQASDRNGDGYAPAFFDTVNHVLGISPYLMVHGYQSARYVVYSYSGVTTRGGPQPHSCLDTFTHSLLADAQLLAQQLATLADSTTDVYLIGH
jgi:hypothetical protein